MDKQGPTLGKIAAMVIFTLGCFATLLFLWLEFGGSVPLKAKQYEMRVDFPEATTLAENADVRLAGVTIGKVRKKELNKGASATRVDLAIDPKYAPLPADTKAILRQKTLLGETYVELTPGSSGGPKLADGGTLKRTQVEPTVELDEILEIFDEETKKAFRTWVKDGALITRDGAGKDLNAALGNLSGFATDGADVFGVLDDQRQALRLLVRNTGQVFGALNERNGQLRGLIENSHRVFSATAEQQEALAQTFEVFPTFLDESRLTLARLEEFSRDTEPLIRDLQPVADDLAPTITDVSALAPDLESFFVDLRRVIPTAVRNLPEAQRFLRGAAPTLASLHIFLQELNPILSFANFNQQILAGFVTNGSLAFNLDLDRPGEAEDGVFDYVLQQFGIINETSLGVNQTRPAYDRGNAYIEPNNYKRGIQLGIPESHDCKVTGGEKRDPSQDNPPCFVEPPSLWSNTLYPLVEQGDPPRIPAPRGTEGRTPADPNRAGGGRTAGRR
jgi:phospholipid/cholesterol/gamma-HCH transport system substrate-binding protein